jgi:hypothetical protein
MRYSLLLVVCLLVGCGSEDFGDRGPKMPDDITEENAEFKITHSLNNSYLYLIDQWWVDVEECTGITMDLTAAQLHIEYINANKVTYEENGEVKEGSGVIWVDYQYTRVIINDLKYQWGYVTRHEMMHYILFLDGQNRGHDNPMFAQCNHLMVPYVSPPVMTD